MDLIFHVAKDNWIVYIISYWKQEKEKVQKGKGCDFKEGGFDGLECQTSLFNLV